MSKNKVKAKMSQNGIKISQMLKSNDNNPLSSGNVQVETEFSNVPQTEQQLHTFNRQITRQQTANFCFKDFQEVSSDDHQDELKIDTLDDDQYQIKDDNDDVKVPQLTTEMQSMSSISSEDKTKF